MKKKKILMTVMSLALVLVVAVGGTLAYLSDQSNVVTNTFNVGSGYEKDGNHTGLWLDEVDWDGKDEEGNNAERTETGNEYGKLLPGSVVAKDPTFHLTKNSTTSYVFAYVSGVDAMIEDGYFFTVTEPDALADPAASVFNSSWEKADEEEGFDGWYVYVVDNAATEDAAKYGVVSTKTEMVEGEEKVTVEGTNMAPMFNYVKLGSGLDNAEFDNVAEMSTVQIFGVAVQTANLTMQQAFAEAEPVLDEVVGADPFEG